MAYDVNWFEKNMQAFESPELWGCSFCCFRTLEENLFCDELKCVDYDTCNFVFWDTKVPGHGREILMGHPPREMIEWFDKTPKEQTEQISGNIIKKTMERYR